MKRKITAMLLALAMVISTMPIMAFAAEDDPATRGEVCDMLLIAADDYNPGVQKTDILKGYEDGELHEDWGVTRAEALVMLDRAFGGIPEIKGYNKYIAIPQENFTDIPDWAETELADVFASGIVAGKAEGIFAPDDNVTAEEMKLFIQRVFRVFGTNPKDDFYAAVNKEYFDNAVIPEGMASVSSLDGQLTDNQLMDMMKEISASNPDKNSKEGKIKILYDNYLNKDARNELGFDAIKADWDKIEAIETISDLVDSDFIDTFLDFAVTIDSLDSTKYANVFVTMSINSKEMFEGKAEGQKAAFLKYVKTLFTLAGYTEAEAAAAADDMFNFRAEVAEASLSTIEARNVNNIYNIYSLDEIKAVFPNLDIEKVFDSTGLKLKDRFIVKDVGAMEKMAELLVDENIDTLKTYLKAVKLISYSDYMSDDFAEASTTYDSEVMGIEGTLSDEYYAMDFVRGQLSSYVGEIYGAKYTTEKVKSDITEMINEMIDVYRKRITNLDWMSDATKEKAIRKLDTMAMKVGTADVWPEIALDGMELRSYEDGGSLVENLKTISDANMADIYANEGKEVDHSKWMMMPHIVNAGYLAPFNDIIFPIAILLIPEVYDENASYESNLGAIGYIIGHELSHAFDRTGSQYDENGNAVNWWTEEDAEAFAELCQNVIDFYDGQETAPGLVVNGELTLGENTADMGGLSVALEIASTKENFDYKAMFESFAKVWREVSSRESVEYYLSDVHAPASVRVNRTLQACDKFYEVYGITEGDGMWIAPEERVSIW